MIGVWATLGLVVLAAVAGAGLMRAQGAQALVRLQAGLASGGGGVEPVADRALLALAGLLLLVPGFFTDALGLSLLVPPLRRALIRWGAARVTVQAAAFVRTRRAGPAARDTIEADYEIVEDPGPAVRGRSGWTRPDP